MSETDTEGKIQIPAYNINYLCFKYILGGFDTCTDYRKTYISWYFIQFIVLKNVIF